MSMSNTTKRVKETCRKTHRKFSSEENIQESWMSRLGALFLRTSHSTNLGLKFPQWTVEIREDIASLGLDGYQSLTALLNLIHHKKCRLRHRDKGLAIHNEQAGKIVGPIKSLLTMFRPPAVANWPRMV